MRYTDTKHNQTALIKQLLGEKRFTLIVLDACRYDIFERIHREYLTGSLTQTLSRASSTYNWLRQNLPLLSPDTPQILSAHPLINSQGTPFQNLRVTDHMPRERIVDAWESRWNQKLGTVPPQEMTRLVSEVEVEDRSLMWYVQPHFPWISDPALSRHLLEGSVERGLDLDAYIALLIREGELSKEKIRKTYEENLRGVLRSVSTLADSLSESVDKIVVTSDHGELLGEHGQYLHGDDLNYPELTTVPWLVVSP